jgi:hypothetical protein
MLVCENSRMDDFKFKFNPRCTLSAQILCAKVQPRCNFSADVTNRKPPKGFVFMNKTAKTFFPANATITLVRISSTAIEKALRVFK